MLENFTDNWTRGGSLKWGESIFPNLELEPRENGIDSVISCAWNYNTWPGELWVGIFPPPRGMRSREDESAGTKENETDVQLQAEMESVHSLVPAIPTAHYSRLFWALTVFLLTIPLQHLCIFVLNPHFFMKLAQLDIWCNQPIKRKREEKKTYTLAKKNLKMRRT